MKLAGNPQLGPLIKILNFLALSSMIKMTPLMVNICWEKLKLNNSNRLFYWINTL